MFKRNTSVAVSSILLAFGLVLGASGFASATPIVPGVTSLPNGSSAYNLKMSPDGTKYYTVGYSSKILTSYITATNQVASSFNLPSTADAIIAMTLSPDGNSLYLVNEKTIGQVIIVNISGATPSITATITVGNSPKGVAITPDGTTGFVSNGQSNNISVFSTSTNTVTSTIAPVQSGDGINILATPTALEVSPNGSTLYVGYQRGNTAGLTGIASLNARSPFGVIHTVYFGTTTSGPQVYDLALTSDGSTLFASSSAPGDFWIKKYVAATLALSSSNPTSAPSSKRTFLALSADNTKLYASSVYTNDVNIFDTSDMSRVNVSGVAGAQNIAVSPTLGSQVVYVGNNGNDYYLLGSYISPSAQTVTGPIGATITSSSFSPSGLTGTVSYSVSPLLPSGFTLNTSTGVISGISSTVLTSATYTVTATNGTNSANAQVTLSVTAGSSSDSGSSDSNSLANTGVGNSSFTGILGIFLALSGISLYFGSIATARKRTF